jgi:hypothetical protein
MLAVISIACQKIDYREIESADAQAVIGLLTKGFPSRSHVYWTHAISVLSDRALPLGFPRYGYVMTADDRIVGVILLIFSASADGRTPRCNLSSWYVEPEFRVYASLMVRKAVANKDVVYTNISPAPHTRRTIAAQGFSRFTDGVLLVVGSLSPAARGVTIREIAESEKRREPHSELLADHARAGCVSVTCDVDGESHPFIFLPRKIPRTFVSCAQLIYCANMTDFIRFAGNLARFLFRRGLPAFILDTNGPIHGLHGVYFAGRYPKYFRGPEMPRLGDLTYTEFALFGP